MSRPKLWQQALIFLAIWATVAAYLLWLDARDMKALQNKKRPDPQQIHDEGRR